MSLPAEVAGHIERLWDHGRDLERLVSTQARTIEGLERQVQSLLDGSHMTPALTSHSDLVPLRVVEDLGDDLFRARRLARSPDGIWDLDTEDVADYFVPEGQGAWGRTVAVGKESLAFYVGLNGDDPPKPVYECFSLGLAVLAVVTGCARDAEGNTTLTAKIFMGLPFSYEAGTEITGLYAGVNPLIVIGGLVLLVPVEPPPDNPEITHYVLAHLRVVPGHLNMPDAECLSFYGQSCDPAFPSDPCLAP